MRSWTRAVFFGGAVLVLAACNDATSPTSPSSLNKIGSPAAAWTYTPTTTTSEPTTTTTPPPSDSTNGIKNDCTGVVIHTGFGLDGMTVPICIQITNF